MTFLRATPSRKMMEISALSPGNGGGWGPPVNGDDDETKLREMTLWANRSRWINRLSIASGKIGPVERSSSGDTGSCSRSGIDGKFTPDKMTPLPHTHQAKTSRSFRFPNVKSGAVVTDAKGQFTRGRSHVHVNIVGAAVSCNIVE